MPRVGGIYSEPAGTKAVSGQTVQSVPYNTFIDDLVTDANAARPITAGGTGGTTATDARTNLGIANFVDKDAVQTLTNKSLQDSTTYFVDDGDATKKVQFQVSGITTGTTRTMTWPNQSGTVLVDAGAQTITGLKTVSLNTATTSTDYFQWSPTDFGTGKPRLVVNKSATATLWNIALYDGTNNAGTINLSAATGLTWNSNQLVDVATSQTISGNKTFSSLQNIAIASATTGQDYIHFTPTDYGTGKPYLAFGKSTTATQWNIGLFDGTNSAGTINFSSATGLTWNSVQLVDLSSSQTLTNKTFSGGTFTGTIAGSPTLSGLPTVSRGTSVTQQSYIEFAPTDYATGKPKLYIQKGSSATQWNVGLFDTVNTAGTINFDSTGLTWSGVSLVDLSTSQTLTNKTISGGTISGTVAGSPTFSGTLTLTRPTVTLQDSTTTFQDNGDNTKQFQLQLSGITTATTRTWTVPDSNDTFVGLAASQTLTNKTLGSGTTISNGATLTVFDANFTIQDDGDATKQLKLQLSGITTGTTRTLTAPNFDGTIATLAGTETFTNKTLTSPTVNTGAIANPTVSGTVAGSPTASGTWTFSNSPVVPTLTSTDNSTAAASTAFVQALVGPGSFVKIAAATASTSSSLTFTSIPSSGYSYFTLVFEDINSTNFADEDGIKIQVSTDNGSTWKTTSGDYINSADAAKTYLCLINVPANTATFKHQFAEVRLFGLGNASRSTVAKTICQGNWISVTNFTAAASDDAGRPVAEADNAIRLTTGSGGNISSGTVTLYGIKS